MEKVKNQTIQKARIVEMTSKKKNSKTLSVISMEEMIDIIFENDLAGKEELIKVMPSWFDIYEYMEHNGFEHKNIIFTIPKAVRIEIAITYRANKEEKGEMKKNNKFNLIHSDPYFIEKMEGIMNEIKTKYPLN